MGGCLSCRSSPTLKNVRVVHLNGYVEDFEHPVTVGQVTGKPPKHFVCTLAQLLSTGSKPLKPNIQLEPGHIYFLLPYSTLQSDVSPLDLASMARKLTAIAKTSRCEPKSPQANFLSNQNGLSPIWNSPATSPSQFLEPDQAGVMAFGVQKSTKARSWRPILDTIGEKSFRRSESSLQEKHLESPKEVQLS